MTGTTPLVTVIKLLDTAVALLAGRAIHVTLMLTNVSTSPSVVACPTVAATTLLERLSAAASDLLHSNKAHALN